MRILRSVLLAGLCTLASTLPCGAESQSPSETEYGQTLPPIGYVKFCAEHMNDCEKVEQPAPLQMSNEQWNLIFQVNTFVNNTIRPASDMEIYGQPEYWTYPTTAGDCEDYLLLKKKLLQELGFSASDLLITVVLDEKKEGHAVLTLKTAAGDFILDNRRNSVLEWDETKYTFLKRQSSADPKRWVALTKRQVSTPAGMASNGQN